MFKSTFYEPTFLFENDYAICFGLWNGNLNTIYDLTFYQRFVTLIDLIVITTNC